MNLIAVFKSSIIKSVNHVLIYSFILALKQAIGKLHSESKKFKTLKKLIKATQDATKIPLKIFRDPIHQNIFLLSCEKDLFQKIKAENV